ncbi:MAG: hypothetical protein IKX17_03180 [Prevotella sp.]|nr:hypothetical protein [Prevotella sp.]
MKVSKNQYLKGFCLAVIALGVIRAVFPNVAMTEKERQKADSIRVVEDSIRMATELAQGTASEPTKTIVSASKSTSESAKKDASAQETTGKTAQTEKEPTKSAVVSTKKSQGSRFFNADGTESRRRILSVSSYSEAFPDAQDVQILSANKWGVSPVLNRHEAEERKAELVYVGSNPYFFVEPLNQSIPYLVPHALVLLQDIGRNFLDSLQVKGLQSHKIIVTSVLRSQEDVGRLRRYNRNATENSCHMYGTTFDIAYNRYLPIEETAKKYSKQATVADVQLKQVLSEVLRDLRQEGRCWVKYEVRQGCFHLTVR